MKNESFNIEQADMAPDDVLEYKPKPVMVHYSDKFSSPEGKSKVREYLRFAGQVVGNRDLFLGEGGAAKVFDAEDGTCIKISKNRHKEVGHHYNLGNSPEKEFDFMERLHGFERAGCRSPIGEVCIEVGDAALIVMEKLDAVNLQLVFNGQEELPEGFDFEAFYNSLDGYIGSLHSEMGVAHNDLFPRNVMIDKTTGMPYVIDFGRSVVVDATAIQKSPAVNSDWDNFDSIFEGLEKYRNNKVEVKKEVYQSGVAHLTFTEDIKVFYSRKLLQIAESLLSQNISFAQGKVEVEKVGNMTIFLSDSQDDLSYAQKVEYKGNTFYIGKLIKGNK
jgi:tRNA A-37 threonylcarbamoyl transferase component Bud32